MPSPKRLTAKEIDKARALLVDAIVSYSFYLQTIGIEPTKNDPTVRGMSGALAVLQTSSGVDVMPSGDVNMSPLLLPVDFSTQLQ